MKTGAQRAGTRTPGSRVSFHPLGLLAMPRYRRLSLGWVLLPAFLFTAAACVDRETHEVAGAELYAVHCASCHGREGRGDGPVAASLDPPPPDLTTLASRPGGRFDETTLLGVIDGRYAVAAHGPREMPVWGAVFVTEHRDDPFPVYRGMDDARALVDYLRTLQRDPE